MNRILSIIQRINERINQDDGIMKNNHRSIINLNDIIKLLVSSKRVQPDSDTIRNLIRLTSKMEMPTDITCDTQIAIFELVYGRKSIMRIIPNSKYRYVTIKYIFCIPKAIRDYTDYLEAEILSYDTYQNGGVSNCFVKKVNMIDRFESEKRGNISIYWDTTIQHYEFVSKHIKRPTEKNITKIGRAHV